MASIPVLHLQPLSQIPHNAWIDERLTAGIEPRLVAQRAEQDVKTLPQGVVTEIVKAGLRDGDRQYVVASWHLGPHSENLCQYTDTNMSELSTPEDVPPPSRRRYDSPARRQQAAETRERIIAASADLVRGLTTWEWDELTFRSVAELAGVSERTVYRHFPSERHLHDAVMRRLEDDAGITYEDVELANLADATARVFASLHRFAIEDSVRTPSGPTFAGADQRRQDALIHAVTARAPHWTHTQRAAIAGLLDVLWSPLTYERLVRVWKLDDSNASSTVQWLIGKVVEAVDNNELPRRLARGD